MIATGWTVGRRALALLLACGLMAAALVGCGSGKTSPALPSTSASAAVFDTPADQPTDEAVDEPTDEPTAEEAPTPEETPSAAALYTEDQVFAACSGTPVPGAEPYGGSFHALSVVSSADGPMFGSQFTTPHIDDIGPYNPSTPLQLVICHQEVAVRLGSCGTYKRSDGVTGDVIRYRDEVRLKAVIAGTGKTLTSKTIQGGTPSCPQTITGDITQGDPPWTLMGDLADPDGVNLESFLAAVAVAA